MKYVAEMGSDAMIRIPSFKEIGSGIQKLKGGGSYTGWRSYKPFIFSRKLG
jgi:hypothetical protein